MKANAPEPTDKELQDLWNEMYWEPGAQSTPNRPEGELVVLPAEAFDALASRLEQPGHYDPRVARVLSRKAPWE